MYVSIHIHMCVYVYVYVYVFVNVAVAASATCRRAAALAIASPTPIISHESGPPLPPKCQVAPWCCSATPFELLPDLPVLLLLPLLLLLLPPPTPPLLLLLQLLLVLLQLLCCCCCCWLAMQAAHFELSPDSLSSSRLTSFCRLRCTPATTTPHHDQQLKPREPPKFPTCSSIIV